MTPTLAGRLQTRVFAALTVGLVWTALLTPFLGGATYGMTYASLALMTLLGLGWEGVYHLVQQARWDKDWPSLLALVTIINEAPVLWFTAHALHVIPGSPGFSSPFLPPFVLHIASAWLAMWLFLQGPIRVLHPRWRFDGGRVVDPARRRPAVVQEERRPAVDPVPVPATCSRGHVGHPELPYCMVCGTATYGTPSPRPHGPQPPAGILILPDGTSRAVDGELETALLGSDSSRVRIRLVGRQPVISSPHTRLEVALPGGGRLRADPGVPVPLVPGAEFVLCDQVVRFESPYAAADTRPEPVPMRQKKPRSVPRRHQVAAPAIAAAILLAVVAVAALATGLTVVAATLGIAG